ncbi:MAG: LPS-assembly protein LptD [Burkholderiales bacterium]|nr:LPS-assembly protein LptD [Burkholderiales bacterium]
MTGRAYFGRCGSGMVATYKITTLVVACIGAGVAGLAVTAIHAQTLSDVVGRQAQAKDGKAKDRLLVESRELVYDRDKNTVSAVGNVQLYYQGKVLEADKVLYDRNSSRVFASGNAKLTEENGQIVYGEKFELTDDFRDGFIDSLRVETTDRTRFAAPRAERTAGDATVFEQGTYTACEPCKDDPSKPPLWQVRSKRIIHRNEERTIYYEGSTLEFYGVPMAYIPYFSAPDNTVKRKSGFLPPHYVASSALGYGLSTPYFWAIAPNYDLTVTPTFMTRQGVMGQVEWRHRLMNGSYNIKATGIFQQDKSAFLQPPFGAGDREFRGSIESSGRFLINNKWQWGWDISGATDKWFDQNYKNWSQIGNPLALSGFRESISTLYLTGQGERSYFDARGYYIRGLSYADWQKQIPTVAPLVDYDRRFVNLPIGGELALNANLASIQRAETDFFSLVNAAGQPGRYQFPVLYSGGTANIYDTCAPGRYNRIDCLVRGVAGSYTRATTEVAWRRTFIDPIGQSWTPFGSVRGDLAFSSLDTNGAFNQYLPNFIDTSGEVLGRVMPVAGLTYRYPFVAPTAHGTHVIEPIGQIIARPQESLIGKLPNEDAQSLVYDDTNLFAVNKFSGYDRVEGGTRANVGAQYSYTAPQGAYVGALFGQSYQIGGYNSYAQRDLAHTGMDSGLETSRADYVGRLQFTPNRNFSFISRGRFNESDFALRRVELQATASIEQFSTSLIYARYAAQPDLGYFTRREGLGTAANINLTKNWYVNGSVFFDLSRNAAERFYNPTSATSNPFTVSSMSIGAGYRDECTTLGITYSNSGKTTLADGTKDSVQTIMLRLELRTLGGANYNYNVSGASGSDGL